MEKYGIAGQAIEDDILCSLKVQFACKITKTKVRTHIRNIKLFFCGNGGYVNAPHVALYVSCPSCLVVVKQGWYRWKYPKNVIRVKL